MYLNFGKIIFIFEIPSLKKTVILATFEKVSNDINLQKRSLIYINHNINIYFEMKE